ncbi:hypothetical protein BH23PLA1_BH23PLA1_44360 [soil metagenome]
MTIAIECPNCGKAGAVPDHLAGRSIRCRGCDTRFLVPQPAPGAGAVDDGLPPGLEDPEGYSVAGVAIATPSTIHPEPVSNSPSESIPLQPEPEPKRPPSPTESRPRSGRLPAPTAQPGKRLPTVLRAFLFFLFKLVLAALLLGYTTALAALPMLQEGTWLYVGLGGFAVVTILYLVLVRLYYRAYPRAFPDRPR